MPNSDFKKIIVIGAGPAGMMAAIRAAQLGQDVTLIEKNSQPGKKLLLSGKGRCNLTNLCGLEQFLNRFSANGQFLRDAFKKFFHPELIKFFAERGLKVKVERQLRVFPVTDRAGSVVEALKKQLLEEKVKLIFKTALKDILTQGNQVKGALLSDGKFLPAERIILATGGASCGASGSTGEGMRIAGHLGHSVIPLRPGLVALEAGEKYIKSLEGLALKNIRLKFSDGKKELVSEIGELLFTAFGVSGPLVLSCSGRIVDWLSQGSNVYLEIDLKPGLSREQLDARLLREFQLNSKKAFKNTLKTLLPLRLIDCFIGLAGIGPRKTCSQINRQEREKLLWLLKGFRLKISRARPLDEAIITRGGVSLKEINPRTMESRRIKGLYFAGEMIDLDADTGGFNLQAAFSTGYLAGESAAQ
ncbi:MAG: NAD(P)/FAD-dependent oxidoreductase [Candidatus Omnitrophota bacterium]|nr:NAD(P)/FAD-dependent oxidoreductase [Candidatus Omnitrophota bacterium]